MVQESYVDLLDAVSSARPHSATAFEVEGPKAKNQIEVRLSEVLGALSYALDLTEGQPPGHSLRCCWIAMHIGHQLHLSPAELSNLYYATLLKDAGCSSNAARLWELYGGDERTTKHNYKTVDSQSLLQIGRFVLQHAGAGEALRERIGRVMHVARHGPALKTELIQTRCERGAEIVRRLGFGEEVAAGIYALDEHWNGKGKPEGIQGDAIPLTARIALLAQVADAFHAVSGPKGTLAELKRRSGTWFDPRVVEAFASAAAQPDFWPGLADTALDKKVAALEPVSCAIMIDEDRLDQVAEAFAAVIDAKSQFTSGHSERVTTYACEIAQQLGWGKERKRWLRRAALLHDIGKLGVSNAILDKPGRLNDGEWTAVKRHAELSETILQRSSVFRDMALVAGAHHERLDGGGYPRRLRGAEIPIEARIITTADIYDALTAKRPYREPLAPAAALALMESDRNKAIDGTCLDALEASLAA